MPAARNPAPTPLTEPLPPADRTMAEHAAALRACRLCPGVQPPPVVQPVAETPIYMMGQAPGPREREQNRPFTYTAGTTLFRWFAAVGVEEAVFRERVFMGAVVRCFPGKLERGGDRAPARQEIANCSRHWRMEFSLLRPRLLLLVGRHAMEQFLPKAPLDERVGRVLPVAVGGLHLEALPLPHPSGLSRWRQTPEGKARLHEALQALAAHPVWREVFPHTHPPAAETP